MLCNMMKLKEICSGVCEYGFIDRQFYKKNDDCYTPIKYRGIYTQIGIATIWNEVGCIEASVKMYAPVNGGTILYDVDDRLAV